MQNWRMIDSGGSVEPDGPRWSLLGASGVCVVHEPLPLGSLETVGLVLRTLRLVPEPPPLVRLGDDPLDIMGLPPGAGRWGPFARREYRCQFRLVSPAEKGLEAHATVQERLSAPRLLGCCERTMPTWTSPRSNAAAFMRAPRALPPCGGVPTFATTSSTVIGFFRVLASLATVLRNDSLYCCAGVSFLAFALVCVAIAP